MPAGSIYIVAGPTASGKSARALELAQQHNGVIINCDSMQIYDALPLLAAQPCAQDLKAAPHKLYGALHPNEPCSAGGWRMMAEPLIEAALSSGQAPIICGGTGLYIKALTDGLSPIPPVPAAVRAQGEALMAALGCPAFYDALIARDPLMEGRFHPNHSARILRAWEVLEATGKSLAYWQAQPLVPPPAHWDFKLEMILPPREKLYANCDYRFTQMLEAGALEEVAAFKARCESGEINAGALITNALGFKSLCAYLDGACSLDEAVTQAQTDTRRYAKRQMTWFRNQF